MKADYLAHHGVKGQKWGIRRYQNEDGSLTNAGKQRYQKSVETLKGELEQVKNKAMSEIASSKTVADIAKAKLKIEKAKESLENARIRQKIAINKYKSNHRKSLESHYTKQGMSKRDAEVAAWKREQTEKILAIAGSIALASLTMYAYKKYRTNVDSLIPKGTKLQHITLNPNKGVSDAFYASYTKADKKKYIGMYGGFQLQKGGAKDIHIMTTQAARNLSIAGAKVGKSTVQELIKTDPEYVKAIKDAAMRKSMTSFKLPGYSNLKKAISGKAKLNDDGFNAVNTVLNDPSKNGKLIAKKLYDKLREKGYDGVVDTHDIYVSGYRAQRPIVLFSGESSVTNKTIKTISSRQVKKKSLKYLAIIGGIPLAKIVGRTVVQTKVQNAAERKVSIYLAEKKVIDQYKKDHPNTKLSNRQILNIQLGR